MLQALPLFEQVLRIQLWRRRELEQVYLSRARLFCGGARFQSSVDYDYTGSGYTIHQGGLTIFGLIAQYLINFHADINLAINHLFDKRYYSSLGQGTGYYYYGAPR